MLSDLCDENLVPNEFFSHHGSLSKELRTTLESRLQKTGAADNRRLYDDA